jgi:hypothetical protein
VKARERDLTLRAIASLREHWTSLDLQELISWGVDRHSAEKRIEQLARWLPILDVIEEETR